MKFVVLNSPMALKNWVTKLTNYKTKKFFIPPCKKGIRLVKKEKEVKNLIKTFIV